MFPGNIEFFGRERDQERLQDIQQIRLAKIARGGQNDEGDLRRAANWLGRHMIEWGEKLQDWASPSSPDIALIREN